MTPTQTPTPPLTPEQIADRLASATTQGALDRAICLIAAVPDPAERAHLLAAAKAAETRVMKAAEETSGPLGLPAGQQKILREELKLTGQSPDTFALHFGCDLQQLPASRFEEAVAWCHRARS